MVRNAHGQYDLNPGGLCASFRNVRSLIVCCMEHETIALMYFHATSYVTPYKPVELVSCSQSNIFPVVVRLSVY